MDTIEKAIPEFELTVPVEDYSCVCKQLFIKPEGEESITERVEKLERQVKFLNNYRDGNYGC